MGTKAVVKYVAGLAAILVAMGLSFAAPSYAAKDMLISGSGVGPYKMGTTGKKALHSKLYTKPQKLPGCPTIPPAVKGKASKAIGVDWSGKKWTKKSKVDTVYVYGAKVGKKRVVTKQGVGVGAKVKKVERRVKHLKRSSHLAKWVPVLSVRSGKHWINFVVDNFDAQGHLITSWSKLKKQPVSFIEVTNKRVSKIPYGGSGGC